MSQTPDDVALEARRAERRNWPVKVIRRSELETDELVPTEPYGTDLSAVTTVEERFAIMRELAQKAWASRSQTQNP